MSKRYQNVLSSAARLKTRTSNRIGLLLTQEEKSEEWEVNLEMEKTSHEIVSIFLEIVKDLEEIDVAVEKAEFLLKKGVRYRTAIEDPTMVKWYNQAEAYIQFGRQQVRHELKEEVTYWLTHYN